jgi:hypothetical protein
MGIGFFETAESYGECRKCSTALARFSGSFRGERKVGLYLTVRHLDADFHETTPQAEISQQRSPVTPLANSIGRCNPSNRLIDNKPTMLPSSC